MIFYREANLKETLIGEIPKDWSIPKLANLIEIETGKRAKGGALDKGNVASIGGEHIDYQGNIRWDDMKFIPDDFYNFLKQGKVNFGDILLVKDGATTGKVAMVKNLKYEKVAVNEHVFLLRSKTDRLSNGFLFYFLFSRLGRIQIKTRVHGIIGGIIRNDLETVLIPLPPLQEQQKITEILSVVDLAIGKVDEVIAKIERLKKDLMQELLTKGIGHKEFKDTKIGKTPKEWQIVKLGDILTECYRYPTYYNIEYVDHGVPEIRGELLLHDGQIETDSEKIRYVMEETAQRFHRVRVIEGDLIFSVRGTMGKVGFVPKNLEGAVVTANLMRLSPDRQKAHSKWLLYYLTSNRFQRTLNAFSSYTTIKTIQAPVLKSILVPLPAYPEQRKIAEILSTIDKRLELGINEKGKLKRIKRGLMDLLLTGKVRVKVAD